jgi:hypothetical protein
VNLIKEKEYLLKLQCYFEDIFLREIEANQRDSQFNDLLIKVCLIIKKIIILEFFLYGIYLFKN